MLKSLMLQSLARDVSLNVWFSGDYAGLAQLQRVNPELFL